MYRIAIGEISHETNTFCPPTTLEMFREREWIAGAEIIERHRDVRTYLGGMIDGAEREGIILCPAFAARTEPWGTITREAFEALAGELTARLHQAQV